MEETKLPNIGNTLKRGNTPFDAENFEFILKLDFKAAVRPMSQDLDGRSINNLKFVTD